MANGRPRNPGQLICPRTGQRCPHVEPPPACRHVLEYIEPEQDDVQLIRLMVDQHARAALELDAGPWQALDRRPGREEVLKRASAASLEPSTADAPPAIETAFDPVEPIEHQRSNRGRSR
jgi:hypothetical protein